MFFQVWVIAGPVFDSDSPDTIGDPGEAKIAIPDAAFKVVVREDGTNVRALSDLSTRLAEAGMNVQEVQYILGHSDPNTTMRYMYLDSALSQACG